MTPSLARIFRALRDNVDKEGRRLVGMAGTNVRNMSDEEYAAFKTKTDRWNCGYDYGCGGNYYNYGCWDDRDRKTETKNESTNDQKQ